MSALAVTKLSVEQYLALDRAAEIPSEYHDGEMFPLESASLAHSVIQANICRRLGERLDNTPCVVAGSALRVRVSRTKFVHPDVLVYCGKAILADEHADTLENPKLIVEILSPSTKGYDYSDKFMFYRQIESFEEYVLVSQNKACLEVFHKGPDTRWVISTYDGLGAVVGFESLGVSIPMTEIYASVEFPAAAE